MEVWEEERGVVSPLAVALGVEWAGMVLKEAMCRRELETGNVPILDVAIRTSPGEWSVTNVKLQNLKALELLPSLLQVIVAEEE